MNTATIVLHPRIQVGRVDPRIFGGFLEHLGRAIYDGVYQPGAASANDNGLRSDLADALRRLAISVVRYPGGNFVSGYDWEQGVGPIEKRPVVRDLAWESLEPNTFGTDEFLRLCAELDWDPMITVNLGTGTPEQACNWVEYCNGRAGSRYADLRVRNGHSEPYGVKLWCLGNEMDAPWQLGHTPAEPYAVKAEQAGRMMKRFDPSIELVVCGSCLPSMETYMDWDRTVLEYVGDVADYIGFHRYVGEEGLDVTDYLAVTASIDRQIEEMDAVCRFVQAKKRASSRAYLCFDEWNIWYRNHTIQGQWSTAPRLLEERYNLEDALVAAGFLLSFIRHADVLKVANLAQLVNVLAPILTEEDRLLRQTIYWPFAMISSHGEGKALRTAYDGSTYRSEKYGEVPTIDHAAILNGDRLSVFLVNKDPVNASLVRIKAPSHRVVGVEDGMMISGTDPKQENTFEEPDAVGPTEFAAWRLDDGLAEMELPPLSFVRAVLRLEM